MTDYHAVFLDALDAFVRAYEAGRVRLYNRADMVAAFYHHCLNAFEQHDVPPPYPIRCNVDLFGTRERASLLIGNNAIAVELRLEPNYDDLPADLKPFVFTEDIQRDFDRLRRFTERGIKHGYSLLLDEDGWHLQSLPYISWRQLGESAHLLIRHFEKGMPRESAGTAGY